MPTLIRFARALTLRCPRCGGGGIFASWLALRPSCPTCGLTFTRGESGYQVGSYLMGMIAIEVIFVGIMLGVVLLTWPTPPWTFLTWGGPVLMLFGPIVLFPFTKTIFLAMDLTFRPDV